MRQLILFITTIIAITGCQTMKSIAENPDTNVLDFFRKSKSFSLGDSFPEKGYKLQAFQYHNVELLRFDDNDTLYYIKYNPKREERNFFFTVINKQTVDTILVNTLSNNSPFTNSQRRIWLYNALNDLGIRNLTKNESLWTYFSPKYKMVKGNLPTEVVRTGFHREYEKFNFETAMKAYYEQRQPQHKLSGMEILGALYIINILSPTNGVNTRYSCKSCGLSFSNPGELRSHENAIHDY